MVSKLILSSLISLTLGVAICFPAPAEALSTRAWVSAHGADTAGCALAINPCRTFQFAHDNVSAGGEIDVLDQANFGVVTITKAISIVNDGAGIALVATTVAGQNAITINAAASDNVFLRGLTIDGFGVAANGVRLNSGGVLTVVNCTARHFTAYGILVGPASGATKVTVSNVIASENGNSGIFFSPTGSGTVKGAISQATTINNGNVGIFLNGASTATVVDSVASNNSFGFATEPAAVMRLGRSVATANGTGVFVGSPVFSYGDNKIDGNIGDIAGALTPLGMR